MLTRIQKWGNSQGLRLSREILEDARLEVGEEVDVSAGDGMIVIAPKRRVRGRQDLRELVNRIPRQYEAGEADWGKPRGKEVW